MQHPIKKKMAPVFRAAEGGLFSCVEKADVGASYQELERQGVALMGWADPFMPDHSMPDFVEDAYAKAARRESAAHYA
ncbi:MAG: pyridoxal phosphate-dependent aminotransferase, partial [Collinsella bouchesdurhonensis]|nr:pyridoxal phosphate-dependent aminotransferase [Collinsella bouchesdurhonensis]